MRYGTRFLSIREVVASICECDGHHEMSDLGARGEPVHSGGESVAPVWPHQRLDGLFAGLMEKIMTFTERELRDDELMQVSGGVVSIGRIDATITIADSGPSPLPGIMKVLVESIVGSLF